MTPNDTIIYHKLIVVFDMCSSSNIIEDLTLTSNIDKLKNIINKLKKWLRIKSKEYRYEIYKYIGDGWILLFPVDITGNEIINFLKKLNSIYYSTINSTIIPYLERDLETTGLTFGIEKGPLTELIMLGKREFLGRALNIAFRLQNAAKGKGGYPDYPILVSNQVYNEYLREARGL